MLCRLPTRKRNDWYSSDLHRWKIFAAWSWIFGRDKKILDRELSAHQRTRSCRVTNQLSRLAKFSAIKNSTNNPNAVDPEEYFAPLKVNRCDILFELTFLIIDRLQPLFELLEPKIEYKGVLLEKVSNQPWFLVDRRFLCPEEFGKAFPDNPAKQNEKSFVLSSDSNISFIKIYSSGGA